MSQPYSPHPNWRRNFEFTAAYTNKNIEYKRDPIIEYPKPEPVFIKDSILHKFDRS